ncbi:MAG: hypothetical protein H6988_06410 [Pseudomonadales bacterium]|nr:hypothetical protein [Halieaceae bacterium]MCP5165561.1 hypothetical protein [Pseudomonadales bacterium]MCP5190012.1 hypothetical protein [Pseudomonadales bacterium]
MTVLSTYLTALAGMILISCGWLAVQRLWQRHFPGPEGGEQGDALAGRSGCHGCNCEASGCEREAGPAARASSSTQSSQLSPQQAREAT